MPLFTLTVSLDDLGLDVVADEVVEVTKNRLLLVDAYPPVNNLYKIREVTDVSGLVEFELEPDDDSTFHKITIHDLENVLIYERIFIMPSFTVAIEDTDPSFSSSTIQIQSSGTNLGTPYTVSALNFIGAVLALASGTVTLTITPASIGADVSGAAATAEQAAKDYADDGLALKLDAAAQAQIDLAKIQSIIVACSDETTALTTGVGKVTFRMPYAFTVSEVRASLTTAQASGSIFTVDINEGGTTILSTKLTIDNTEKTSTTATTAAVISDAALADDAEITIDINQVGDGTAKGLKVVLIGTHPFMVGATPSTVINYEFNGTDGDTTTTDSTGNTTASGLGIVSGSEFAHIQSNNLFAQNNYTTIDDSGALSPYLIFEGDFEIEVALRFSGNWNFYTDVILWQLEDALGVVMELFVNTVEGRIGLVGNPLSLVGGSVLISGSGAVPDLSNQQVFKVTRVGSTISIYVDNVFKVSATSTGIVNAGRFKFFTDYFERYVDYLRIKKA